MQRSNRNRAKMNGHANDTKKGTNGTQRSERNEPRMNSRSPSVNGYDHGKNNAAVTDGYSSLMNGSVPCVDLKKHMERINDCTNLSECNGVFAPIVGPGRKELDSMKNRRKVRTPRNLKLYDDDSDDKSSSNRSFVADDFLDDTAMAASLRMLIPDPIVSNNAIERRWTHPKTSTDTSKTGQFVDEENKAEKPKKHGTRLEDMIVKNVAIRGIVEHRKEVDGATASNFNAPPKNVGEQSNSSFSLVPDEIEPDFFYRKIQNRMPDDYFIVEHVGKVTKVTPRQFLIENIEPEHFVFQRKNKH